MSGFGTWMIRSNLPGLVNALSNLSGKFVAAMIITPSFWSNLFTGILIKIN